MNTASKLVVLQCLLILAASSQFVHANDDPPFPPFANVEAVVRSFYQADPHHQPKDLISRSQVQLILQQIEVLGWQVADRSSILEAVLEDQHVLVTTLRSPHGRRFMTEISGRQLMYDRLDRISGVSGGPQLIRDLVKLPDGDKYAKPRSGGGVPDLLDLLPKNASGKTRKVPDYHKPTGHIYTVSDLIERLKVSYREAEAMHKEKGKSNKT